MQPDNNYPSADELIVNDGASFENGVYYPDEPEERTEEEREARAAVAGTEPIIANVKQWFAEQIADSKDRSNIQVTTVEFNGVKYERKVSIEAQLLAYELLQEKLENKLSEFENLLKDKV